MEEKLVEHKVSDKKMITYLKAAEAVAEQLALKKKVNHVHLLDDKGNVIYCYSK